MASASSQNVRCNKRNGTAQDQLKVALEKLKEESNQLMSDFYQAWWQDNYPRMVCIPPCRDMYEKNKKGIGTFQGPIDSSASDYDKFLIENRQSEIDGNLNEALVLAAFQKSDMKQCVLVNGFDSSKLISSIKAQYPHLKNTFSKLVEYEVDFLLFHPNIGIVIGEVKSTLADAFEKGKYQLSKVRSELPKLYAAVTDDDPQNFPPISLIIFVPQKSSGLSIDLIQSSRPEISFELIGKELVQDKKEFKKFWSQKISQKLNVNYFQSENFRDFVAAIASFTIKNGMTTYQKTLHTIADMALHLSQRIEGQLPLEKEFMPVPSQQRSIKKMAANLFDNIEWQIELQKKEAPLTQDSASIKGIALELFEKIKNQLPSQKDGKPETNDFELLVPKAFHLFELIEEQLSLKKEATVSFKCDTERGQKIIVLNSEQTFVLRANVHCQIIYGPPGSGKSLILQLKALTIAKQEQKHIGRICISSSKNHATEMAKFLINNGVSTGLLVCIPLYELSKLTVKSDDHLFVDEMGVSKFAFWRYRSQCKGTTTCIVTRRSYISDGENFGRETIEHPAFLAYKSFYLQTILRGTKEIIYHWFPKLEKHILQRNEAKSTSQQAHKRYKAQALQHQPIPFAKEFAVGHSITGISVVKHKEMTIEAVLSRLKTELDFIFITQSNQTSNLTLSDVAIMCDSTDTASIVRNMLKNNTMYNKCGRIGKKTPDGASTLVVDVFTSALSLEWPIVISLSLVCSEIRSSFALLSASRATAHLIVIKRDCKKIQRQLENKSDGIFKMQPYASVFAIRIETEETAFCFDTGLAMFRNNLQDHDLFYWAVQNFNVSMDGDVKMCAFVKEITNDLNFFDCFALFGKISVMKINKANDSSKYYEFKSFVNKNAKIINLLGGNPLHIDIIFKFAEFWCQQVADRYLHINNSSTITVSAREKAEKAPRLWWAIVTLLDFFISATCDVWYDEQLMEEGREFRVMVGTDETENGVTRNTE